MGSNNSEFARPRLPLGTFAGWRSTRSARSSAHSSYTLANIPVWIAATLWAMGGNVAARSSQGLIAASEIGRGLAVPGLWVPAFPARAVFAGTSAVQTIPVWNF